MYKASRQKAVTYIIQWTKIRVMRIDDNCHVSGIVEYKDMPFLVQVYDREMYINWKTGEIRGINMYNAPSGMKEAGKRWVICECMVANIRPNNPYSANDHYEDIDKHARAVEPYEVPKRSLFSYSTKKREVETTPKELAQRAACKIKERFNDQDVKDKVPKNVMD